MAENVLKIGVEGELAYIALNRPEKRNAINQAMLRALPEALDELDRPEVRAIILYGEGQAFSAGSHFPSLTYNKHAIIGVRVQPRALCLLPLLPPACAAVQRADENCKHR